MSMRLTTRVTGDVVVIDVTGRLTLGEATRLFREKIKEVSGNGGGRILIDLGAVTLIDSSGLGELLVAYSEIRGAGGEMKLLNLGKRAHDLLTLTKLHTVFEVFEDGATALRSFSPKRPSHLPGGGGVPARGTLAAAA